MKEYWESRFKGEGAMWKFEPSDSALLAVDLFKSEGISKILIPGFGYGRNAKLFIENGFAVSGIEISKSAIELAKANGITCKVHYGSVVDMPFDAEIYDGIFCYALIHLLNQRERKAFLKNCFNQIREGGLMIFAVISINYELFGTGRHLSKNRFKLSSGLNVFFYDDESVESEFAKFGLMEFRDIDEPVKFMEDQQPLKCKFVICRKK